jgi:hypothetical protein
MKIPEGIRVPRCRVFDDDYDFRSKREKLSGISEGPVSVRCKAFDVGYDKKGKSKRQEKRIAELVGGRVQPASGATQSDPLRLREQMGNVFL